VTLYHLATDRQPHTSSLVNGSTVQALEGDEEALEVLFVEAYAVVLDEDLTGSVA
jgi:hypothetical protein